MLSDWSYVQGVIAVDLSVFVMIWFGFVAPHIVLDSL